MAELTPRLGLKKPLGNETVSRAAYNENLDIIDETVETPDDAQDKADAAESAAKNYADVVAAAAEAAAKLYAEGYADGVAAAEAAAVQANLEAHQSETMQDEGGVHGLEIEEGTWTPFLMGLNVAGNHTYSEQGGYYYKTGKKVFVYGGIRLTGKDAAMDGSVAIGGLPFTVAIKGGGSAGEYGYINLGDFQQLSLSAYSFNSILLVKNKSSSNANNVVATDITDDSYVYFSAEYLTN